MLSTEEVLPVLSIIAIISTVSLFLCGIPICLQIWRRKSTQDISSFPLIMGFLGACFWLRYGILRDDWTMTIVNLSGSALFFSYCLFYLIMSQSRALFATQLVFVVSTISFMVLTVNWYGDSVAKYLGFACMTFNICCFAAPLAGVKVVLEKCCTETLPLPLCFANFAVSSEWLLYGLLIKDGFVMVPNACGVVLSIVQLTLFVVFPYKPGRDPLVACCSGESAKKLSLSISEKVQTARRNSFAATQQAIVHVEAALSSEVGVPLLHAVEVPGSACSHSVSTSTSSLPSNSLSALYSH